VALLGEGWDCPAINSLILASCVGSFMLSNQMRGRAIRVSKTDPDKVANIWHLVGIARMEYRKSNMLLDAIELSGYQSDRSFRALDLSDYRTLQRRFLGFVGIAYNENVIQNGMERLEIFTEDDILDNHLAINGRMYQIAKDREQTRRRWREILALFGDEDIKLINTLVGDAKEPRFNMFVAENFVKIFLCSLLGLVTAFFSGIIAIEFQLPGELIEAIIIAIFAIINLIFVSRIVGHFNPVRNMQKVGNATLSALSEASLINTSLGQVSNITLKTPRTQWKEETYSTKLRGATVYENNLYIKCIKEIYQRVENPRYVIKIDNLKLQRLGIRVSFFAVPSVFAVNKTRAQVFYKHWKENVGAGRLVYTRTATGREILFKARRGSFDYNDKFFELKKASRKDYWK
jgi:hypothetical protein